MLDISSDTATASTTATVCENLATFGAVPERGELDSREVWDEDDAIEALGEAIRVMVDGITVDGTQMADEREALMWGFVNMLLTLPISGQPIARSARQWAMSGSSGSSSLASQVPAPAGLNQRATGT